MYAQSALASSNTMHLPSVHGELTAPPEDYDQPACLSSGFQGLDELTAGGWQQGGIVELLSKTGGCGELRLLLPALATLTQSAGLVTLVGAPQRIHTPAWAISGVEVTRLQCIYPQQARDILVAVDTALDQHHNGAVVAWIQHALPEAVIRYLQRKAQASNSCVFFLRASQDPVESKNGSSLLRLFVMPGQDGLWVSLPGSAYRRQSKAFIAMAQRVLPPVVAGVIRHAQAPSKTISLALAA